MDRPLEDKRAICCTLMAFLTTSVVRSDDKRPVLDASRRRKTIDDDDDEIVYALTRKVVEVIAPVESMSEPVAFEDLPYQVQIDPTKTFTWARQTPEYLYLETYAPPQCEVCLEVSRARGESLRLVEREQRFVEPKTDISTPNLGNHYTIATQNTPLAITPGLSMPGSYSWS